MAFPDLQTLNIFENANISSLVGVITTAIDEDTGENAVIYYYIVGKFDGIMKVESCYNQYASLIQNYCRAEK